MLQQLRFDPRFTAIFILIFLALGIFTVYSSNKRLQKTRARGQKAHWFTDVSTLTGSEYILLAVVLAVNLCITIGLFPVSISLLVVPIYYLVILLAAAVMLLIIYQSIFVTNRQRREAAQRIRQLDESRAATAVQQDDAEAKTHLSSEQQARKRDRRKKAAAARRRQAGRA
jgi:hypothetical protein